MSKTAKFFAFVAGTIAVLFLLRWTGLLVFNNRQVLSIGIFSMFIYGTLLFGEFRLAFAFGGIALLMACDLLTVQRFTQSASLDVIVFLIGTFLVIGYLEETRFFEHVVNAIVRAIGPRPELLLIVLMAIGSIASALVGEVTAVLFMAGAMLHLTSKYKLDPIPFIIMLVFACNNGSAMSSVGNPIGVLIALKTGLSFVDFLKYAAPTALVVDAVVFLICRWYFAAAFSAFDAAVRAEFARLRPSVKSADAIASGALVANGGGPLIGEAGAVLGEGDRAAAAGDAFDEDGEPLDSVDAPGVVEANGFHGLGSRRDYLISWAVLVGLIALLVTHKQSEALLGWIFGARLMHPDGTQVLTAAGGVVYGLREGTMMVGAALIMGSIVLFIVRERARELVERRVDWWTLSFFMMLFASVGTLEDTKVTEVIAAKLSTLGGSQMFTIQVIGWATGWLSAFLDNVLAVATFMPVVHDVRAEAGVPYSSAIYWFMLFGGTFMGNMTIIGSTANIVAVGLLEKRGYGTISFGSWMRIGFLVAIASMLVATGMLALQSRWIPMLQPPTAAAIGE